jgi:hypothetical protein
MNRSGLGLILAALSLFFTACEKDVLENRGTGEKAEIFFSINTGDYNTGGNVVRSAGILEAASTTMYLNDSTYLRATLVPDSVDELRAPVDFIDGQRICVKAFDVSVPSLPVEADSKIYSYSTSAGKFIPLTTPLGVYPDGSTPYRFVAYSYFGEADVTPGISNIDPIHDLVWGKTAVDQAITDTETSRTVTIHMTHKFARVRIRVRSSISSATITTLSGVTVEGGKLADLTPFDGGISYGNAVTQGVSIASSGTDISSSYRTVSPVSPAPIQVKIGTLEVSVSGTTFSNQTVSFNSTLGMATSYTLVVDVKRILFARSNIYWDGSKLTFVPAGTDGSKEGYQGLFFFPNSLVGISPAGAPESALDSSTPCYKAGGWGPTYFSSLADVPGAFAGEICQYIDPDYRLPKSEDFLPYGNWVTQGSFSSTAITTDKTDGTYDFIAAGYGYLTNGNIRLPPSGQRGEIGGYSMPNVLRYAGLYARYWTSSVVGGTNHVFIVFGHNGGPSITVSNIYREYMATPIRCVRD